jgi:hypothetical protein
MKTCRGPLVAQPQKLRYCIAHTNIYIYTVVLAG